MNWLDVEGRGGKVMVTARSVRYCCGRRSIYHRTHSDFRFNCAINILLLTSISGV